MDLIDYLRTRLLAPLPGLEAHRTFVPDIPDAITRLLPPPPNAKRSAVIVPIIAEANNDHRIVFTVRSENLRSHKGQISFPGGRLDDGEDAETGALRELHEEIGVHPSNVVILGGLSPLYIPPSNSAVTPFIALIRPSGPWVISEEEVTEVLDVPLSTFLLPDSIKHEARMLYGKSVDVPQWNIHPTIPLWGATAMILNELLWLINEYNTEQV
ncbi:MAG: CoA pyrophosphatase [Candidatus Kapabacteria bacterium]|nr:CoA pyrophosphatase [Candidatus Kapabacteria bacterium]